MNNIIQCAIGAHKHSVIVTRPAWLYDYGMKLKFVGIELPAAYEVDFANNRTDTAMRMIGGADGVDIPNDMFLSGIQIFAWLHLHNSNDDGYTVYEVEIPLRQRPEGEEIEPTPHQQDAIEAAITALNDAVERTSADVVASDANAERAENAAQAAASSASAASTSETNASSSATQAASSATAAAGSASSAASANTAAQQAKTDAETAKTDAETAARNAEEWAEQVNPEQFAKIDGYYEDLTSGNADQLTTNVGVKDAVPYNFRKAGGGAEIGNRVDETVIGGSIVWNQLADFTLIPSAANGITYSSSDGKSVTFNGTATNTETRTGWFSIGEGNLASRVGHKIAFIPRIISGSVSDGYIVYFLFNDAQKDFNQPTIAVVGNTQATQRIKTTIQSGTVANNYTVSFICIDLTAMFGSTIADYVYNLEQTTAGAGVNWFKKLFPADYYAYNAGTMAHVQTSAHETTEFNQYDPATGTALVLGGMQYQITGAYTALSLNGAAVTPDASGLFTPDANGVLTVTGGNSTTTCVHLVYDGSLNGEYQPYVKHTYPLDDSLTLRGIPKLDANDKLYFDGDIYKPDGTVTRRYGVSVLDGVNWKITGKWKDGPTTNGFAVHTSGPIQRSSGIERKVFCDRFIYSSEGYVNMPAMTFVGGSGATTTWTFILPASITSVGDANAWFAANPTTIIYELDTPTTEEADPFQSPQIVDDFGTERYVDAAYELQDRDFEVPVGHESLYQANLKAKLERSPNSPSGDGDYIVRQTNGSNAYVPLEEVRELPTVPTEDGTYTLKATVSGGTATLAWVSE